MPILDSKAKETPIIFSTDMVRAILDGRKTQTRRVITLKNYHRDVWVYCVPHNGEAAALLGEPYLKVPYDEITDNAGGRFTCPYGQVGDLLWVRETFCELYPEDRPPDCYYLASYEGNPEQERCRKELGYKWQPSIHMNKKYARIWLEITGVRVERLQEIEFMDCVAEGISIYNSKAEIAFANLWDSINAKRGYGWSENPWVWVIEFKKKE